MLIDLHIRNFAIAEDLALEFSPGLSVLTGETGAGKSILIGALGLVLGDRADTASVRSGADKAEISASFDIDALDGVARWLTEHELDADGECHLRRVVSANGRSRAFVNGNSVALQSLRELGAALMDIHGQHEHQRLTRPRAQRALLDGFGKLAAPLQAVHEAFDRWYRLDQQVKTLSAAHTDKSERIDLLRFQVRELEDLGLTVEEYRELDDEHRRISHLAGLVEGVASASDRLSDGDSAVQDQLGAARRALAPLVDVDRALSDAVTMLDEAQIQVDEAASFLRRYADGLDMDPAERDRIEQRLDQVGRLARKHRVEPEALPATLSELSERLDGLENADTRLEELAAELQRAAEDYRSAAAALTRKRKTTAKKMAMAIESIVRQLGMPASKFRIVVSERSTDGFGRDGMDDVTFEIAANPGQPARPIAKVASGGELSRVSLAVQVVAAKLAKTRCMVFDEVDAGIGGAVAQIVGEQLRDLAGSAQVLCVTHLAQVASQAHQHYKVSKAASDGTTRSAVTELDDDEKVEELARMLGGVRITKATREHAAEMLSQGGRK